MSIPVIMIRCLFFTILIECSVAFILRVKEWKDYINIVLVNIITNPLVVILPVYFLIKFNTNARIISLIILELLAVLVEGFIYKKFLKYKKINPYLLSLILNLSSYLIGEIINRLS